MIASASPKSRLGMTRRVRQRHGHLPQTKVPFANVILHDRLLAREAMFVTKTLEDPLRRVPLLAVNRAILFQNAVDDIRERRQLRALRRLASPISRRFRMQQYLGNRLAVDPELARSFPSAQTLTMTRQSHSSIKIHSVHPPPSIRSILTKAIDGPILVRRRNRTNRPIHWGIIAPPFSSVRDAGYRTRSPGDRRQAAIHGAGCAIKGRAVCDHPSPIPKAAALKALSFWAISAVPECRGPAHVRERVQ